MRARLGINNCFAVKRWPRPGDWAQVVRDELGLDLVELSLDLIEDIDVPAERERAADQIRAALSQYRLQADTTFTGLAAYSQNLLMHPDPLRRRAAVEWYLAVIDMTARLGAKGTGGHVGAMSVPDWTDRVRRADRWSGLRQGLAELTRHARDGRPGLLPRREPRVRPRAIDNVRAGDATHRRRHRPRASAVVPGPWPPVRARHQRA